MTDAAIPILAYVASPVHVLSALAAISTFHPKDSVRVTLVVNHPTAEEKLLEELHGIAKIMTNGFPLVDSCLAISNEMLSALAGRTDVDAAAKEFRELIGFGDVAELYYFHDVMGLFFPMLAQSYPRARRICYGDCLGIAYERQYHLSKLGVEVAKSVATPDPAQHKLSFLHHILKIAGPRATAAQEFVDLSQFPFGLCSTLPHAAALILPIDESGFLQGIPRLPVAKSLADQLLKDLLSRCKEFQQYESELLAGSGASKKFLLLTECNTEAEFLTFDRDIEMYCSIVEQHCPPGSVIYRKPHPSEHAARGDAIRAHLGDKFKLIEFDPRFKRYPIEFAPRLARECVSISMSYPSLSLPYLYGADVITPMNKSFIEEWYPQRMWEPIKSAHSMLSSARQRLANWDGKSLLWSGGPTH